MPLPLRFLLQAAANAVLVWCLSVSLPASFFVSGGLAAYIAIGGLMTILNLLVRPILQLITLPLRLFATILSVIIVNAVFLWITEQITIYFIDPDLLTFEVAGGIGGWITVSLAFGFGNWIVHLISRH